jgi:hypothetical protein
MIAGSDPERRLVVRAKAGPGVLAGLFLRYLHDDADGQRSERNKVELTGFLKI